jgi:uncharacterized membrane protein
MAIIIPKPYIKKTVIEQYPTAVIIKSRVSIKAKFIIFINTSYILIKSRKDIETKNAQNNRRLKELKYP